MCYVCDGDWKAEVQSAQEPSFVLAWCVDCVVYLDLVTTVFYFISLARFYLKVCRSEPTDYTKIFDLPDGQKVDEKFVIL